MASVLPVENGSSLDKKPRFYAIIVLAAAWSSTPISDAYVSQLTLAVYAAMSMTNMHVLKAKSRSEMHHMDKNNLVSFTLSTRMYLHEISRMYPNK